MSARRHTITWLCFLLFTGSGFGHVFDGDGPGPSKGDNVQAYLYVEPYSCRVECLMWLPTALTAFKLPQGDSILLPASVKETVTEAARKEAGSWCALHVDGVELKTDAVSAVVLKGRPGRTETLGKDDLVAVMDSMLGLMWEFDAPMNFEKVEIEWRHFFEGVLQVPVTVIYGPMTENGMVLKKSNPKEGWQNKGRMPAAKPLAEVPPLGSAATLYFPLGSLLWIAASVFFLKMTERHGRKVPGRGTIVVLTVFFGAAMLWRVLAFEINLPWTSHRVVDTAEAEKILFPLLRNTYRAFDQRDESAIYDVLSRSIDGDLLQKIYLQTTQALSIEGQDGTRVKVTDLDVRVEKISRLPGRGGFTAEGQWTALGTVGHWGHLHQRINRYKARINVEPVNGAWKVTGLEVLEERRI